MPDRGLLVRLRYHAGQGPLSALEVVLASGWTAGVDGAVRYLPPGDADSDNRDWADVPVSDLPRVMAEVREGAVQGETTGMELSLQDTGFGGVWLFLPNGDVLFYPGTSRKMRGADTDVAWYLDRVLPALRAATAFVVVSWRWVEAPPAVPSGLNADAIADLVQLTFHNAVSCVAPMLDWSTQVVWGGPLEPPEETYLNAFLAEHGRTSSTRLAFVAYGLSRAAVMCAVGRGSLFERLGTHESGLADLLTSWRTEWSSLTPCGVPVVDERRLAEQCDLNRRFLWRRPPFIGVAPEDVDSFVDCLLRCAKGDRWWSGFDLLVRRWGAW